MSAINNRISTVPIRVFLPAILVLIAALATAFGSIDAYLVEDDSAIARSVYQIYPLIRYTFSAMYITTMVVFVFSIILCLQLVFSRLAVNQLPGMRVLVPAIGAFTALAAFWGIALRRPVDFLLILIVFSALLLVGSLIGHHAVRIFQVETAANESGRGILVTCVAALVGMVLNLAMFFLHIAAIHSNQTALIAETRDYLLLAGSSALLLLAAIGAVGWGVRRGV